MQAMFFVIAKCLWLLGLAGRGGAAKMVEAAGIEPAS